MFCISFLCHVCLSCTMGVIALHYISQLLSCFKIKQNPLQEKDSSWLMKILQWHTKLLLTLWLNTAPNTEDNKWYSLLLVCNVTSKNTTSGQSIKKQNAGFNIKATAIKSPSVLLSFLSFLSSDTLFERLLSEISLNLMLLRLTLYVDIVTSILAIIDWTASLLLYPLVPSRYSWLDSLKLLIICSMSLLCDWFFPISLLRQVGNFD